MKIKYRKRKLADGTTKIIPYFPKIKVMPDKEKISFSFRNGELIVYYDGKEVD